VAAFSRIPAPQNLHNRVTHALALRLIEAERSSPDPLIFPNEAELCNQLGVSRTILREAVKVLEDKGMIEVRPRSGTRARPRSEWNLLDPDILAWQAELSPEPRFLRDLCEVRLAIEPTAAGFAALRATPEEIAEIGLCLERRRMPPGPTALEQVIELDLQFHEAVVAACHNPLLKRLSAIIRPPFRMALSFTSRLSAARELDIAAYWRLFEAISRHDPVAARAASDEVVGLAMLAVEEVIRTLEPAPAAVRPVLQHTRESSRLFRALVDGDAQAAVAAAREALEGGELPLDLVNRHMIPAMDEVGRRFQCEQCFVPELLLSGRAMKSALDLIRPRLAESGVQPVARVVIGTVKGDLHDAGKNLVASMLEGGGFEVIDLGTDVSPERFVEAVRLRRPDILALSCLLSITMPSMRATVEALERAGLRAGVKLLAGGAPVSEQFARDLGAEGYSATAAGAVSEARRVLGIRS
jgi:methanogenic corrinoid protein MtbC1/DNA-binding FadR family transcriptional regulator